MVYHAQCICIAIQYISTTLRNTMGTESFSKDYTTHQSRLCTESMIATNGRFEALQTAFHIYIHYAMYTEILSTDAYIRAWQLSKSRRCGCDKGGAFSIVWEVSKSIYSYDFLIKLPTKLPLIIHVKRFFLTKW